MAFDAALAAEKEYRSAERALHRELHLKPWERSPLDPDVAAAMDGPKGNLRPPADAVDDLDPRERAAMRLRAEVFEAER